MSTKNIPTHPLPDWLSGKHDEEMRRLCAEEVDCKRYKRPFDGKVFLCAEPPKDTWKVVSEPVDVVNSDIPNYPASLDACIQLRAALKDEEWHPFVVIFHKVFGAVVNDGSLMALRKTLNATPRQIVLAFLLTRNRVAIA